MKLTNLTAREDGTLQGMAPQMKAEGQEQWLISNSEFTLNTHRYNQIALVFQRKPGDGLSQWTAGDDGEMGAAINQIEKSRLVVGKGRHCLRRPYGRAVSGFSDPQKALSAAGS